MYLIILMREFSQIHRCLSVALNLAANWMHSLKTEGSPARFLRFPLVIKLAGDE